MNDQGYYTCTPYNDLGTAGQSPPTFLNVIGKLANLIVEKFVSTSVGVQDQSWSWLFCALILILVLVLVLALSYVQSLWTFIVVSGLDIGTSGLKFNTGIYCRLKAKKIM